MNQFNLSTLATSAGVLGLVKALQGLVTGLRNVATQSLQNYAHFESMQKGLETFFQSAEKGKSTFETLRKLSNETTFGVDELAGSFTQLANVGVAVDTINDKLMMLGNLSQGDKQKFADLVSIYSKVMSTGKAGSMQLQQFAMRGLPIYDVLKKMGVQGQATGKQITEAFKQMTQEGGQFYNAMNNINDTIEGKQGFISDYFKEMMVNLADVSGLADMYKSILDTVREAIGKVSDKLKEWNDNPVAKAIFQGALIGTLTAIGTILTGTIVVGLVAVGKQLKSRIAELVAINALTGNIKNIALAGLLVGAGTGLAIGLSKYVKEANKATEELETAIGKANTLNGKGDGSGVTSNPNINPENELNSEQKKYNTLKARYLDLIQQKERLAKIQQGQFGWAFQGMEVEESDKKELDRINKEIQTTLKQMNSVGSSISLYEDRAKGIKAAEDFINKVKEARKEINEMYETSSLGETEKELNSYKEKVESIKKSMLKDDSGNYLISEEEVQRATDLLEMYENKIRSLNGLAETQTWREYWKAVTGAQIGNDKIKGMNGTEIGNITTSQLKEKYDKQASAETSKADKANVYKTAAKEVKAMVKTLLSKTGLSDEEFRAHDKVIQSLNELSKELESTADDIEGFSTGVLGLADKLKEQGKEKIQAGDKSGYVDYAKGAFLRAAGDAVSGTDAGTFLQSWAQTGSVIIAVIETVIGGLFKVITSIEDWDEGLNGVQDFFERLKPILEILIRFAQDIIEGVDGVLDIVNIFVAILTPVISFFRIISKIVIAPLKLLGALFRRVANALEKLLKPLMELIDKIVGEIDDWYDALDSDKEKEEEEKEQAKDLTNQYKALIQAMKEQEEYYEKRKTELNAQSYNSRVTGVHDMILTPQGNFSTDPDDYIIATKNPSELNSGGSKIVAVRPIINNTIADKANVDVSTQQNDEGGVDILVQISEKIAQDYANGANGWDSAVSYRNYKAQGRTVLV